MSQQSPKANSDPNKVEQPHPEAPKEEVNKAEEPHKDGPPVADKEAHPKDVVGDSPNKDEKKKEAPAQPVPAQPAPAQNLEGVLEAQMTKQETQDDAEIKAIKEKMTKLKDQQPAPEKKDEMIKHLLARLQLAEQAIIESEETISHERANRKQLSANIKKANAELRDLVEKEKKQLSQKVATELEKTLEYAVKEKMTADENLGKVKKQLEEKTKAYDELDKISKKMQEEVKTAQKLDQTQKEKISQLEEELKKSKEECEKQKSTAEERKKAIEKMDADNKDALTTMTKLEEARIVLNRLIGPGGAYTEPERQKFLNKAIGFGSPEPQMTKGQPVIGITAPSNKALQGGGQYLPPPGDNRSQRAKPFNQASQQQYAQPSTLVDEANEDEFWYQTPKAADIGGNNYQAPGGSRGGNRKPGPPVGQGPRY